MEGRHETVPTRASGESAGLGYALVDADNHYYEPYDCFTRYLEPEYRDRTVEVVHSDEGPGRVFVGGKAAVFRPLALCDAVAAPGANQGALTEDPSFVKPDLTCPRLDLPASMNRESRLELMDEQGLEAAIMLPSTGVCVEYDLHLLGADVAFANLRAFNRWLEEDWGYAYENRIFGVPMLSLADLDLAVRELERVLDRGARMVHINPGPAHGRSPSDVYFDPFWARLNDVGVPVVFHIGHSGYNQTVGKLWGQPCDVSVFEHSPLQSYLGLCDRPIVDTLAALVLGGLFSRFPALRVVSIENGSRWLRSLLADVDHAAKMSHFELSERPSEALLRHLYVTPFWEDDCLDCVDVIGSEHVLFGSDFPHPEGQAIPARFEDSLSGLDAHAVRRIMRENTAELLRL